ncbi:MAG: BadF/BadG/BcrA/BcrD ATPase family protein [Acidobacteriota bacterium]
MSFYLGIDLGSTTTKAVLLDDNEDIIGRGITNTRSDYHVATSVAENEARVNARFTLLSRELQDRELSGDLLERLEDQFQIAAFRFRLARLRHLAEEDAGAGEGDTTRLSEALADLFGRLEKDLDDDEGAARRSRRSFFRDIVGTAYMRLAESEASRHGLDFEDLMAVYDKVILEEENTVLDLDFEKTLAQCDVVTSHHEVGHSLREAIHRAATHPLTSENMVGTGYGRQRLPFRKDQIRSEILCHGLGAHAFFPATRTVLDIGGQDTKAIQIDEAGIATNFQMNDRCAAGCGRYLGYIADELNLSLDDLGPMALRATHPVSVSSTCTVFAGAEVRERLELGEKRADILAGLHRAIILRAMSLLSRSGGINEEFTFTGGVARNAAAVEALRAMTEENYGARTLNIDPDSIYTGAVGAALYARRDLPGDPAMEVTR